LGLVRRIMRSYNRMMFEFFRLPHMTRAELFGAVEVEGREHLEQAVARGRGVFATGCHVGNWELGGVMVAHWGYVLHAVAGVQFSLEPALDPARFESAAALNAAVAAATERHIRARIDQWCIFRPLWEAVPAAEHEPAGAAERARA